MRSMAAGTFDAPRWFTIDRHIRVGSKLPWVAVPEGMPVYARGRVTSPPAPAV